MIYAISIILSMLLPILHITLIGVSLKRGKGIAPKLAAASYIAILCELAGFFMYITSKIPDAGSFIYLFLSNIFGITALALQIYGYRSLSNLKEKRAVSKLYLIWSIVIVTGLVYWLVYYYL